MFGSFTTREVASLIWVGTFIIWIIAQKSLRATVSNLIRSVFAKNLSIIYIAVTVYTLGMVYFLYSVKFWNSTQVKNTVFWFFTIGIVSVFSVSDENKENYFKITINNIFSFTVILQFIISVYTFSLITELLLVPLGTLIICMIVVGERDPKHKKLTSYLRNLLNYFGLFLIGYAAFRITDNFKSFANAEVLNDFLIPATFSIMYLPAVYLISLYVAHESTFIGLQRSAILPNLIPFTKWQTLVAFGFNKTDLRRWRSLVVLRELKNKTDIRNSISLIKELKRTEKNPPQVSPPDGWSPYQAKEFLSSSGIKTGYYHPYFDDDGWSANSAYKVIEDNLHLDSIAYYIQGTKETATKLELVLNVNSAHHSGISIEKMINYSRTLYVAALNKTLPKDVESAIRNKRKYEIVDTDRRVSVLVSKWAEHRLNGYDLKLIIEASSVN